MANDELGGVESLGEPRGLSGEQGGSKGKKEDGRTGNEHENDTDSERECRGDEMKRLGPRRPPCTHPLVRLLEAAAGRSRSKLGPFRFDSMPSRLDDRRHEG